MEFPDCFLAATSKISGFGWAGLALGAIAGVFLAFGPWLRFSNLAVDKGVGKAAFAVSLFLGLIAGEIVRVLWTGQCHLP